MLCEKPAQLPAFFPRDSERGVREVTGDTIAAVITAAGIGAMGALRLSGPNAFGAVAQVFRSKRDRSIEELAEYSLTYGGVYLKGAYADQALMLKMKAPHSFTGEDVAELQCHGGPVVMRQLLAELTSIPGVSVRPAEPGEFSRRAFLNGKMDLSQAEAIMELVSASNPRAAALAANQIEGRLYQKLKQLGDGILTLLAEIEMEVDFPEEEIASPLEGESKLDQARHMLAYADALLDSADRGRVYREGIRVVFYGRPNAGKSSLLNGILQEPRAIVTPEPGTTRDVLEEQVIVKGVPLVLTDTAGVSQAGSLAEQAGMDRAREMAARADLLLYVIDSREGLTEEDKALLSELDREKTILVWNKEDLLADKESAMYKGDAPWETRPGIGRYAQCSLSALDHGSLDVLAERIRAFFDEN
ncbi:MAG: tRNA uridine-5-carboxymethylaminomethyl(34) synthesis GTPase MnmE, partial [Clostridiales bacterium]|nr:tRNA uridine-5-carboxymethylaminomethyl(34) synthesis GTPase MnmE [Clostridiales bacterium]